MIYQDVYINIPSLLYYLHNEKIPPPIIIVKLYSDNKNEIYLISIEINVELINETNQLNQRNLCLNLDQLFEKKEG